MNSPFSCTMALRGTDVARTRGFTLVELMVVLVILGMLAAIAAPRVTKYLRKAKTQTAVVQVEALSAAMDAYHLDTGSFPAPEEGLQALVRRPGNDSAWDGPYVKKRESLVDPWGRPYRYRFPGKNGDYDIFTLGADNKDGGEGDDRDIGNW